MDFATLPSADHYTLTNLVTPACFLGGDDPGFRPTSITVRHGRIAPDTADTVVDMNGALILPAGVDMHTHLDKGHIWPRSPNPDGTFQGALNTVAADRSARWRAEDVRRRMEFSLRCAYRPRDPRDPHPPRQHSAAGCDFLAGVRRASH